MLQSQISASNRDRVLLRWSDAPAQATREEPADMLEAHLSEAVISIGLRLSERTEVQLIGRGYHEAGVVRSCRPDGARFILVIGITSAPEVEVQQFHRDPGVLAIERFLTDEQADEILDQLDRESDGDCDESSPHRRAIAQIQNSLRLLRFSKAINGLCELPQVNRRILWLNKV